MQANNKFVGVKMQLKRSVIHYMPLNRISTLYLWYYANIWPGQISLYEAVRELGRSSSKEGRFPKWPNICTPR